MSFASMNFNYPNLDLVHDNKPDPEKLHKSGSSKMDFSPCTVPKELLSSERPEETKQNPLLNFLEILRNFETKENLSDFDAIQKHLKIKNYADCFTLDFESSQSDKNYLKNLYNHFSNEGENLKTLVLEITAIYQNDNEQRKNLRLKAIFTQLKNAINKINPAREKSPAFVEKTFNDYYIILEALMHIISSYFIFFRKKIDFNFLETLNSEALAEKRNNNNKNDYIYPNKGYKNNLSADQSMKKEGAENILYNGNNCNDFNINNNEYPGSPIIIKSFLANCNNSKKNKNKQNCNFPIAASKQNANKNGNNRNQDCENFDPNLKHNASENINYRIAEFYNLNLNNKSKKQSHNTNISNNYKNNKKICSKENPEKSAEYGSSLIKNKQKNGLKSLQAEVNNPNARISKFDDKINQQIETNTKFKNIENKENNNNKNNDHQATYGIRDTAISENPAAKEERKFIFFMFNLFQSERFSYLFDAVIYLMERVKLKPFNIFYSAQDSKFSKNFFSNGKLAIKHFDNLIAFTVLAKTLFSSENFSLNFIFYKISQAQVSDFSKKLNSFDDLIIEYFLLNFKEYQKTFSEKLINLNCASGNNLENQTIFFSIFTSYWNKAKFYDVQNNNDFNTIFPSSFEALHLLCTTIKPQLLSLLEEIFAFLKSPLQYPKLKFDLFLIKPIFLTTLVNYLRQFISNHAFAAFVNDNNYEIISRGLWLKPLIDLFSLCCFAEKLFELVCFFKAKFIKAKEPTCEGNAIDRDTKKDKRLFNSSENTDRKNNNAALENNMEDIKADFLSFTIVKICTKIFENINAVLPRRMILFREIHIFNTVFLFSQLLEFCPQYASILNSNLLNRQADANYIVNSLLNFKDFQNKNLFLIANNILKKINPYYPLRVRIYSFQNFPLEFFEVEESQVLKNKIFKVSFTDLLRTEVNKVRSLLLPYVNIEGQALAQSRIQEIKDLKTNNIDNISLEENYENNENSKEVAFNRAASAIVNQLPAFASAANSDECNLKINSEAIPGQVEMYCEIPFFLNQTNSHPSNTAINNCENKNNNESGNNFNSAANNVIAYVSNDSLDPKCQDNRINKTENFLVESMCNSIMEVISDDENKQNNNQRQSRNEISNDFHNPEKIPYKQQAASLIINNHNNKNNGNAFGSIDASNIVIKKLTNLEDNNYKNSNINNSASLSNFSSFDDDNTNNAALLGCFKNNNLKSQNFKKIKLKTSKNNSNNVNNMREYSLWDPEKLSGAGGAAAAAGKIHLPKNVLKKLAAFQAERYLDFSSIISSFRYEHLKTLERMNCKKLKFNFLNKNDRLGNLSCLAFENFNVNSEENKFYLKTFNIHSSLVFIQKEDEISFKDDSTLSKLKDYFSMESIKKDDLDYFLLINEENFVGNNSALKNFSKNFVNCDLKNQLSWHEIIENFYQFLD